MRIYGDQWVWISFELINKIVIHRVVGRHTQKNADALVQGTKDRSDRPIPLRTSAELKHYDDALLKAYEVKQEAPRGGKRGRPRNPLCLPPPELLYAQGVKRCRKGRIVAITVRVLFGSEKAVAEKLTRKTISFSKKQERLTRQLHLSLVYYHFVKPPTKGF